MNSAQRHPKFWFAYFALSVAFVVSRLLAVISVGSYVTIWDALGLVLALVSLVALYGYAWQRRLGIRWFWLVPLAASVLYLLYATIALGGMLFFGEEPLQIAITLGLIAVNVPYAFGLFQYVFRSSYLWR